MIPKTLGLPVKRKSNSIHAKDALELQKTKLCCLEGEISGGYLAIMVLSIANDELSPDANAEPALNPYQPHHRKHAPVIDTNML